MELLCLPKAVLTPAPRKGRTHRRCEENYIRCRLEMRLDDERQQLLEEAAYSVRRGKLCNDAATRRRRAVALVEESKDSQACKA